MSKHKILRRHASGKDAAFGKPSKIKISTIDTELVRQKGLFGDGCFSAPCEDLCCEYGCDVDMATLEVIFKNRKEVEALIKARIEDCFSTPIKLDADYSGGAYMETKVRESDSTCSFHMLGQKGCALFYLWKIKGKPKRIVPTICRTYPITWHRGRLFIDRPLRKQCKCMESSTHLSSVPSLFDTQKKEVLALFDIPKKELLKLRREGQKLKKPGKKQNKKKN